MRYEGHFLFVCRAAFSFMETWRRISAEGEKIKAQFLTSAETVQALKGLCHIKRAKMWTLLRPVVERAQCEDGR